MNYHAELDMKYRFYPEDWHEVYERFMYSLQDNESLLLVAEQNENLCGYIFGFIFQNYPGFYPRQVGFINDLFVIPDKRKQGIAKKLVFAIESWFKEQHITIFQLNVATPNQLAVDFWCNRGYQFYSIGMQKVTNL